MQRSYLPLVAIAFGALCVIGGAVLLMNNQPSSVVSAVQPGDADAELGTGMRSLQEGQPEEGFLFIETVFHADGITKRVVKTVFKNKQPYLTWTDVPYVLYEYYRPDGSLARDRLVFPEAGLGASVICKFRERLYAADGATELEERYLREDGTLGAVSDDTKDTFTIYRHDGKTLRYFQERLPNGDYRATYYRLDGKTIWWVNDYSGSCKVFFDLDGNPCLKEFTSRSLTGGGFSMSSSDPPLAYVEHIYTRPDKTVEYKQTWYHLWDGDFLDSLGKLEIYAEDGETLVCQVDLVPRHPKHGRFIKQVQVFNADGSKLVRTYRSPNCRESEETFDAAGNSLKKQLFDPSDRFTESLDESMFHGFGGLNLHGVYDDDSNDI